MNCKECGGSMSEKSTRSGLVFECNQDNGPCLKPNGWPTDAWADNGNRRNVTSTDRRSRTYTEQARRTQQPPPNGSELSRWQTCLNCAARVFSASAQVLPNAPLPTPSEIIMFARELFAAKPVAPKPAPKEVEEEEG